MVIDYLARRFAILFLLFLVSQAAVASPKIQTWQTGNGAKVMYVHAPALPMADVRVVFAAGSARDSDHFGLSSMVNALLSEGAAQWDADELASRLEEKGIEFSAESRRDMALLSVRSLSDKKVLQTAVETLADMIAAPRMEPEAIDRVLQQQLIKLRMRQQSASDMADQYIWEAMYALHPYAHDPLGTEDSLQGMTREQMIKFHQKFYVARNSVVVIVGAVSESQAKELAERLTRDLAPGKAAGKTGKPMMLKARTYEKAFPSSQTHIAVGQPALSRDDPDYFPLIVGNHVLGGSGLVSLLGEEVRNKRGLSYGVYSHFSPMLAKGPFIMAAQTKNEQGGLALGVMSEILETFLRNGPSDKELEAAKKNLVGGFPLKISSNKKMLAYMAMMGFYDLPLDWLEKYQQNVASVTGREVREAMQRHLNSRDMVTVILGDL